ncbi:hypothetical protein [Bacillus sp. EB600]|uniref:hypothetical protein n=1 Tax=Bacillus sp. EB600 TaxID=2806345 RepID=UPI0021090BE4|nr:hypothetical protein [Bacillus sp. EB600]MCQ6282683.1 hypothetical protein [Bacillus sp. EB600]
MKKIPLVILSVIIMSLLFGCQNNNANNKTADPQNKKVEKTEKKTYKQNEEGFITDSKGEKIYSITFTGAKAIAIPAGYEKDMPKDAKKILVLNYTYKYIKEDKDMGTLDIEPSDFMVYDKNNVALKYIQIGASDYPFDYTAYQEINAGRSVQTYAPFALTADTPTVMKYQFKVVDLRAKLEEFPISGKLIFSSKRVRLNTFLKKSCT